MAAELWDEYDGLDEFTGAIVDVSADRILIEGQFSAAIQLELRPGHRVVVLPANLAEDLWSPADGDKGPVST